MRILMLHNRYLIRGGEDASYAAEAGLLRRHGHEVQGYEETNERVAELGHVRTAVRTIWSAETYRRVRNTIRAWRPDVVHVQNFFPLISPSAHHAAHAAGIPVVQSLRNYRLFCAAGTFLRESRVCELCLGCRVPWPALRHRCYRGSRAGSAVAAALQVAHRALRTWTRCVDCFIALTPFAQAKYIEGGLPAARIAVKPNFLAEDPGVGAAPRAHIAFIGRLAEEKGILPLLRAWPRGADAPTLRVAGAGPQELEVRALCAERANCSFEGELAAGDALRLVRGARALVFPSLWYEGMPRTLIEAFACGTPVAAFRIGSMPDMVTDGIEGRLVPPGDFEALTAAVCALAADPATAGAAARAAYERHYTAEVNYRLLLDVYRRAGARVDP
jgi:glycosyltransferase involved in cell wall biosynthesis